MKKDEDIHVYSIENLYHFKCCKCNGWWTISDFDKLIQERSELALSVTCPLCGTKTQYCNYLFK